MLTAYQFNAHTGAMGHNLGTVSTGFGAASDPNVKRLQQALKTLAAKVPSADPGPADGIVGSRTIAAVASALSAVPKIPSYIRVAFQAMNVSTILSSEAKAKAESMIKQYAKQLALGIETYVMASGIVPVTSTSSTPTQQFPAGSIQWQDSKSMVWIIAIPKGASLSGSGLGAFVFANGLGNSQSMGDSGLGQSHVVATTSPTEVPGVSVVSESEGKRATTPFYKTWWFWTAMAVGATVVGTGVYMMYSRKQ